MSAIRALALIAVVPCLATAQAPDALNDIVGVWQSDTTEGSSARSTCARSPRGRAVICEQAIITPAGVRHAINFFLVDSAAHGYVYYGLNQPGAAIEPTPLAIAQHVWVYGGRARHLVSDVEIGAPVPSGSPALQSAWW